MTKAYDIKISDLEDILNILQDNMSDMTVIMDAIRLSEYIKRLKREFKPGDVAITTYEQLQDDLEYYDLYKPIYPITERFVESGLKLEELKRPTKYKSILLSDEQVMNDALEFYSHQGSTFSSLFKDFKEEANDHLKFIEETPETEGETIFLKSIGEAFVFTPNYSNITKFTILIHEIQHVLDFYLNPLFSEEFIIRESISMFMEMIATDFITGKYKLARERNKRLQFLHSVVKSQSYNAINKMAILKIAKKSPNNEEELFKILDNNGYDKDLLDFYFEQGITLDFSYQLAYLIAIELYFLYYKDKELTLNICEDIIKNGNSKNIINLLSKYGIKINGNVESYEQMVYKKR